MHIMRQCEHFSASGKYVIRINFINLSPDRIFFRNRRTLINLFSGSLNAQLNLFPSWPVRSPLSSRTLVYFDANRRENWCRRAISFFLFFAFVVSFSSPYQIVIEFTSPLSHLIRTDVDIFITAKDLLTTNVSM